MRHLILLFTVHFFLFPVFGQDISFYKENITMKISNGYFYVTGYYYLETTGDRSVALVYPFPVDPFYGDPDSILVFNLTTDQPVDLLESKDEGVVFTAEFGEYSNELQLLISYRQQLLQNQAEYILESTAGWRSPLQQADYQLIVPKGMEIIDFSIPPDEVIQADEEKIYYWSRKDFMPRANMIFEFR
ncbi:MAG: hypothetical protein MUC31_05345 [Bacteroidales bacterium]|jgi:hypothetical protein|nr:hypothetical protein [Bacteroidales bacterium]